MKTKLDKVGFMLNLHNFIGLAAQMGRGGNLEAFLDISQVTKNVFRINVRYKKDKRVNKQFQVARNTPYNALPLCVKEILNGRSFVVFSKDHPIGDGKAVDNKTTTQEALVIIEGVEPPLSDLNNIEVGSFFWHNQGLFQKTNCGSAINTSNGSLIHSVVFEEAPCIPQKVKISCVD